MKELTEQELTEWAIRFIGEVDYDIQKECQYNLDEYGKDGLVEDMKRMIDHFMIEIS